MWLTVLAFLVVCAVYLSVCKRIALAGLMDGLATPMIGAPVPDIVSCAICESLVVADCMRQGPHLCCMCRADMMEDTEVDPMLFEGDLPEPSEAEVDRLIAEANRLAEDVLNGPPN